MAVFLPAGTVFPPRGAVAVPGLRCVLGSAQAFRIGTGVLDVCGHRPSDRLDVVTIPLYLPENQSLAGPFSAGDCHSFPWIWKIWSDSQCEIPLACAI